jgi:RNA polymerase sigma factor (sigma-70 family)
MEFVRPVTEAEKAAFVKQWSRLVWQLALKVFHSRPASRGFAREDLAQIGFIGLLAAAERFDPNKLNKFGKPTKFITYATRYIFGHIRSEIDNNNGLVRYPVLWMNGGKKKREVPRVQQFLLHDNGQDCYDGAMHFF